MISCKCGKEWAIEGSFPGKSFWCPECPTEFCNKCDGENGYNISCKCWTSLEEMNFADKKAIFALMDLAIEKELNA